MHHQHEVNKQEVAVVKKKDGVDSEEKDDANRKI
jgi:hypothetical protein